MRPRLRGVALGLCALSTVACTVDDGVASSVDEVAIPGGMTVLDQHWRWGSRSFGAINPMSFEGPATMLGLELPGAAATTRVRALLVRPTTGGVPMNLAAYLETVPSYVTDGMGLDWFWRQALPLTCAGARCTIDATVALLPALIGADVYFDVYMAPAGGDPATTVAGEVRWVRLDNGGATTRWAMLPTADRTVGGKTYHLAIARHALPAGVTGVDLVANAEYVDPPGGRDDVCVYLVEHPRGAVGFETADLAWASARPRNLAACPTPAHLVGTLPMREWSFDGVTGQLQVTGDGLRLPAGASSAGGWAVIVLRTRGAGHGRLGNVELDRVNAPWTCAQSAYHGAQYWTCRDGTRHRCEAGSPVEDTCAIGCFVQPVGVDDLCIERAPEWACGRSAYAGAQYWTCHGSELFRCVDGFGPGVASCPGGCASKPLGVDDRCR